MCVFVPSGDRHADPGEREDAHPRSQAEGGGTADQEARGGRGEGRAGEEGEGAEGEGQIDTIGGSVARGGAGAA